MVERRTRSGKWVGLPCATWAARLVRPSYMVIRMAPMARRGLIERTSSMVRVRS